MNKILILIIIIVVLIGGGVFYYLSVNNNEVSDISDVNNSVIENININSVDANTIATVFNNNINKTEFERIVEMLGEMETNYSLAGFIIGMEQQFIMPVDLNKTPKEIIALNLFINRYVVEEAIIRMGIELKPITEYINLINGKYTGDNKKLVLENVGISEIYWDDYVKLLAWGNRLEELRGSTNEQFQPAFHSLVGDRVKEVYSAFQNRINYSSQDDLDFMRIDFNVRPDEQFQFADGDFLLNSNEELIKDLDINEDIKNRILEMENNPFVLTPVIDDGQYYYFGMVFGPEKIDYPPGFTKDDAIIVRFPFFRMYYFFMIRELVFQDGLEKGEIDIINMESVAKDDIDLDNDNDGLPYYLELVYQTNDNKSDTDGDGYDDKIEIDSGNNPID
ncbi:MAG: thrombospondin type 3 repeat-containing protein [Candidatus Kerfeldbacteria bacterium]